MKYNIDDLKFYAKENSGPYATDTKVKNDQWVTAKPVPAPFTWRLKWAWNVLTGKYGVLTYTDQD